jgi:hypothetical protein
MLEDGGQRAAVYVGEGETASWLGGARVLMSSSRTTSHRAKSNWTRSYRATTDRDARRRVDYS